MMKNWENNGTEEIGLVTPHTTPDALPRVQRVTMKMITVSFHNILTNISQRWVK